MAGNNLDDNDSADSLFPCMGTGGDCWSAGTW